MKTDEANAPAPAERARLAMLIDGRRVDGDRAADVVDPATDEVIAQVACAGPAEVELAVAAARRALGDWSRRTPAARAEALARLAGLLEENSERLALAESRNTGKPLRFCRAFDVPLTIDNLRFFAGAGRALEGRASGEYLDGCTSVIRREPVGVVASSTPWNYPLNMAAWKIGPALMAGNTIVLKPAEITPVTTLMLAELAVEAGVPDGVLNVVCGRGSELGPLLARHADVAMLSVTGSTATGEATMRDAAPTVKRLHLELGGKAPLVVFDDADVAGAVEGAVVGAFANCGQDCTAATRIYVQRPRYDEFLERFARAVGRLEVGDPRAETTDLGPLVSRRQRDRVAAMVERARADGATVVAGGRPLGDGGAYFAPTVVVGAAQSSELVQEEVFGPVVALLPFDGDDDGLRLANDTRYGLAASAWTRSHYRAQRAARELQAGTVWINEHLAIGSEMPHGGVKLSGSGKAMSTYSLEEYTTVKHVVLETTGATRKPWYDAVSKPAPAAQAGR